MERDWLFPAAFITAAEVIAAAWISWRAGYPPPPYFSYLIAASVVTVCIGTLVLVVILARWAAQGEKSPIARLMSQRTRLGLMYAGFLLISLQMASLTGLKSALSAISPFWADRALADADALLFFGDPWRLTHHLLSWATPFIDTFYGLWIPIKFAVVLVLLSLPASRLKSQALLSYTVIWAILGMVGAYALSSAGPIFFEGVTGSDRFAPLVANLDGTVATKTASYLWADYSSGIVGFGSGISAMPSLHVAVALWMALIARRTNRKLFTLATVYFALIAIGSVHLGWHYALDGIVSSLGVIAIWKSVSMVIPQSNTDKLPADYHSPGRSLAAPIERHFK